MQHLLAEFDFSDPATRNWYVPLAVLGIFGLGALLLSEPGRHAIRLLAAKFEDAPDALQDLNRALQDEVERLQAAVNQIAESLQMAR
jgi:HPt (histidine-containing phosphotransfer) domain-containing protein